ncbi:hypothetical protein ACFL5V_13270, partial [Fibrobacterota bacterium]
CVSRHDYHDPPGWGFMCATFTSYDCHDFMMQNCIAINSGDADFMLYGEMWGGIWFEHKESTGLDNSARVMGSIFLDLGGWGSINDPKNSGVRQIENCIFWNNQGGYTGGRINGNPTVSLDHITIGQMWGSYGDKSYAWGTGASATSGFASASITNSNITGCNSYGVANLMTSNNNNFYGNAEDFGAQWGTPVPTAGDQDMFVDPQQQYITRIEEGSPLKGAASDGGDIGATVVNRYGVSGTLWGEPGFDELLDEPLWPFPNEDAIKSTMGSWTYMNDGKRGFAADGNGLYGGPITLTSYIWEQLGNPCPPEVCNYDPTEIKAKTYPLPISLSVHPNPFSASTKLTVGGSISRHVFSVFDVKGALVKTIAFRGSSFIWDGRDQRGRLLPNGVYVCRYQSGRKIKQERISIMR